MSSNTESDFYCGACNGGYIIDGGHYEGSARFLLTTGPGVLDVPISIRNIRFNPRDNLAVNNRWIDYRYEAGLSISNCVFESYADAQAGQIYVAGSTTNVTCFITGGVFETAASAFYTGTARFYINGAKHYIPSTDTATIIDKRPTGTYEQYIPVERMVAGVGSPTISTLGTVGTGGGIRVATLADAVQAGCIFSIDTVNWDGVGNATLSVMWAGATAGAGTEVIQFGARIIRLDAASLIDGTTNVAANITAYGTFGGTAKALQETTLGTVTLNTAGAIYKCELVRRGDGANDTYNGNSIYLVGAKITYSKSMV